MPDTPTHSVSVAGIVIDDAGHVLIIQRRDNGQWAPPGGVLELGESFEQGVRREITEETGVDVDVDRLTGVYKNMRLGVVALVFRCRPVAGHARTSEEAAEVRWADPAEVENLMAPAFAVRITDALTDAAAVTRVHDGIHVIDK